MPVYAEHDCQNTDERDSRCEYWRKIPDYECSYRGSIILQPVYRVRRALPIVIGNGELLNVVEKNIPERSHQLFTCVRIEHPDYNRIGIFNQCDDQHQADRNPNYTEKGKIKSCGKKEGDKARHGFGSETTIN